MCHIREATFLECYVQQYSTQILITVTSAHMPTVCSMASHVLCGHRSGLGCSRNEQSLTFVLDDMNSNIQREATFLDDMYSNIQHKS